MKARFLIGIFIISTTTLCLEISLTRYFSISQQYHFAFLVVSIAFLGYGTSGSFLALFKSIHRKDNDEFLAVAALLYSLTILFGYLICNAISFDFFKLSWDNSQIFVVLLFYLILSLPFFFAGAIISYAITQAPVFVPTIYFFDLFGAGAGTALTLVIFLPKGDKGVILILSSLALAAAFLFSPPKKLGIKILLLALFSAEIGLFLAGPSWLSFRISPFKALPVALRYPGAKQLLTKWNAISRIDVIDSPAVRFAPGLSLIYNQHLPSQLGLSVDGGELNAVTGVDKFKDPSLEFLHFLPSSLPYQMIKKPHVLILEPKGGLDILAALHFGASRVKVIENNPLIANIIRYDLSAFSGPIFNQEKIHTATSNSRAALKKEKESYDLIVFALADVFGSSSTGQYGFGEKHLYTKEAFADALDRLSPKGMASMTLYLLPPPRQEARILATWIESLERTTGHPEDHLIAIRSWGTISFFVKKSPFTLQEIEIMKDFAGRNFFDLVAYPEMRAEEANIHNRFSEPLYFSLAQQLLSSSQSETFYNEYLFQIRPVTDNRPFFYNFFKLHKIKETYNALGQKWLPFLQGEFLLPILLLQALAVSVVFILVPVAAIRRRKIERGFVFWKVFFYFSLIGMSFIFIEITFIQKFILFLGHPLYSVALVIFVLLLASGIGSLLSKKILGRNPARQLKPVLLLTGTLALSYSLLLPPLFNACISHTLTVKILLATAFIFPLGFMMGFPFPTGIRLLEHSERGIIPWAWATNAFSSVVSSVAALLFAFWGGYNFVLLLAAVGYLLVLPFLRFSNHRNKSHA
jgi:hypothetical protein